MDIDKVSQAIGHKIAVALIKSEALKLFSELGKEVRGNINPDIRITANMGGGYEGFRVECNGYVANISGAQEHVLTLDLCQ